MLKKLKKETFASIGIDLMGGDLSPQCLFDAVIQAAMNLGPTYSLLVLLSQEAWDSLSDKLEKITAPNCAKVIFQISSQTIETKDEPLSAIRHKKNASLMMGLRLLKKGSLDAFVSLGNTGALIAGSTLILPLLPGIRRPALLASLPAAMGRISILDVGGNVACKGVHLVRFALMGACFERVHFGVSIPQVGLLNVGVESKKGTTEHRLAYQLLSELSEKQHRLKFIGNLEGFEIFQGRAHVLVTDGFTGNILLKSAEGIASYIMEFLKKNNKKDDLKALQARFSSDEHPGAILLGIGGVVIKCHGASSPTALYHGIMAAANYVKKDLISSLKKELGNCIL